MSLLEGIAYLLMTLSFSVTVAAVINVWRKESPEERHCVVCKTATPWTKDRGCTLCWWIEDR